MSSVSFEQITDCQSCISISGCKHLGFELKPCENYELSGLFKTKPYKHQIDNFLRFKDQPFFAIFDTMGLGKTKSSIDLAVYKYSRDRVDSVLVIAPNNVHTQWVNSEFPKHCVTDFISFVWNNTKTNSKYYVKELKSFILNPSNKLKVFAVNVEAFQYEKVLFYIADYVKNNKVFIILDEATKIKNPRAKRTKNIHKLSKYGERCILTGTPVTKNPVALWSMFEFLNKGFFGVNHFVFDQRYNIYVKGLNRSTGQEYRTLITEQTFLQIKRMCKKYASVDRDAAEEIGQILGLSSTNVLAINAMEIYSPHKRLEEIKAKIAPYSASHPIEDCLDMPDKVYTVEQLEMSKAQRKAYTDLQKKLKAEYEGKELTVKNKVSLCIRLMQLSGGFFPDTEEVIAFKDNIKLTALLNDLEELGDKQVIVSAIFTKEIEMLYEEIKKMGLSVVLYYGKTSSDEREKNKAAFLNGETQVFLGNPSVMSFGLNLQVANHMLMYSNSYNVEYRIQLEKRIHRTGQNNTCFFKDYSYTKSIDEKVMLSIADGKNLNDTFTDLKDLL